MKFHLTVFLASALLFTAWSLSEAELPGKGIYDLNCAICHGPGGRGDGAPMPVKPKDLTAPEIRQLSNSELLEKISAGKPPYMPPWEHLGKQKIQEVIKYIRSLGGKK